MTKPELQEICERYGSVDEVTLRTKIENGEVKSRGIAIVQFSTKQGAANALRNLPFEEKLGTQDRVIIEFYQSRESRMQETDHKNMLSQQSAVDLSNLNPTVQQLIQSEPVQQAIMVLRDKLRAQSLSQER